MRAVSGLNFDTLQYAWGKPFDLEAIEQKLERRPRSGWLWMRALRNFHGRGE